MGGIGIGRTPETGTTAIGATGSPTTTTVGRRRAGVILANVITTIGGGATSRGSPSSAPAITSGTTVIGIRPTATILPTIPTRTTSQFTATEIWNPRK